MPVPKHRARRLTIPIIRRAVWVAAIIALGYAAYSLHQGQFLDFLIAVGIFTLAIPVDMLLHLEETVRQRSPFGPVERFGLRPQDPGRGGGR